MGAQFRLRSLIKVLWYDREPSSIHPIIAWLRCENFEEVLE